MYSYEERLRAVEMYIKLGKRLKAVIPSKSNRKVKHAFNRHHYRNRNVIERFFARIKQFRRVATRYDKLASRFMSFVLLAASMLWLK